MKVNDLRLEHIDKISLVKQLEAMSSNPHSTSSEMARRHTMLDVILCTVHRDGGHYINKHGYKKATEDAVEIIAKLVQN
ncbi:hypothetical protein NVP1250O_86 [Vibrio phage 1.250.O._10N.261.55.E11]|nr:hypothetical protein NVP1250O_86 [Vibrio phage 1.250.O._10N.261.55.E11]